MMKQTIRVLVILLLSCVTSFAAIAQNADDDYILGVGDSLNVQVFGEPDLSFSALPVVDEGKIVMPLIGEIKVAGLSVRSAQSEIRRRLADGYLISPVVSVSVAEYRPVYVVGEVRDPGKISYSVGMTVRNAVILAGGMTESGDEGKFVVERSDRGGETIPADESTIVRPGDTVNVGRFDTYSVRGAVQYPERLKFQADTTLKKAIDLAGGFADDADLNNIKLERGGRVMDVASDIESLEIEPNDILTVGALSQQEKDQLHIFVKGEVTRGGRYEYSNGMTVEKAIVLAGGFSSRASPRKIDIRREGNPPAMLRRVELTDIVLPGDIITVGASIF